MAWQGRTEAENPRICPERLSEALAALSALHAASAPENGTEGLAVARERARLVLTRNQE